jgi:hypothetical protein
LLILGAAAGPATITGGTYVSRTHIPTMNGDSYIEFNFNEPNFFDGSAAYFLEYSDMNVEDVAADTAISGRL